MGAISLESQINKYLSLLSNDQKQTVLTVVKSFAKDETAWWEDESYLAEMNKRVNDLRSGAVAPVTLDQLMDGARKAYKSGNKK